MHFQKQVSSTCLLDFVNPLHKLSVVQTSISTSADITISQPKLDTMISSMDKSGSGKVTFEEWRDFLLLLPRPASLSNVWKYWTLHAPSRLATSIATQDLDVILAEKPTPHTTSASHPSHSAPIHSHSKHDEEENGISSDDEEESDNSPIFAGSGAYLLAGGLAGAGRSHPPLKDEVYS